MRRLDNSPKIHITTKNMSQYSLISFNIISDYALRILSCFIHLNVNLLRIVVVISNTIYNYKRIIRNMKRHQVIFENVLRLHKKIRK